VSTITRKRLAEIARPANAWLLLRIAALDVALAVLLPFMRAGAIVRLATTSRPRRSTCDETKQRRIVRYTDLLIHSRIPILRGTCLKRSVLLCRLLNREGVPVLINFGVAREHGVMKGHAWLSLGDDPYYEAPWRTARYEGLYRQ
jgi:hypothetical protein